MLVLKILNLIAFLLSIGWLIFSFDWEPAIIAITLLSSLYSLNSNSIDNILEKYKKWVKPVTLDSSRDVRRREQSALKSIMEFKNGIEEREKLIKPMLIESMLNKTIFRKAWQQEMDFIKNDKMVLDELIRTLKIKGVIKNDFYIVYK